MRKKRGQMWSVDVIIGVIIFISVIMVFYSTLSETGSDVREVLEENAEKIVDKLSHQDDTKVMMKENVLNNSKMINISKMNYTQLKEEFNIQGDFCIYLQNENGRLVPIGNKSSFGKGDINVSQGVKCNDNLN